MDKFFGEVYDSFLNRQTQYGGKVREYVLGRHMFSVPDVLKESPRFGVGIDIFPPVPPRDQVPYRTACLRLKEILWKTTDHQKEFEALWRPVREKGINSSDAPKDGYKDYAENLDADRLFNFPAVCIAYDLQSYDMPTIETFIALPQCILHITEDRLNHDSIDGMYPEGATNIETAALQLFSCYSWGKSRNDAPGAFYTHYGKIHGYIARDEVVELSCPKSGKYPELFFKSDIPMEVLNPAEWSLAESLHRMNGYPRWLIQNVVRRAHMIDGVEFMEYADRIKLLDKDEETLLLYLRRQDVGTAERPDVLLVLDGSWEDRAEMALLWNHIVTSFNYAQPVSGERARR